MSETSKTVALTQLIGAYGVQCSETKKLAPTKELSDAIDDMVNLERALAAANKQIAMDTENIKRIQSAGYANQATIERIVAWLETNQPDVFSRGLWEVVNPTSSTPQPENKNERV